MTVEEFLLDFDERGYELVEGNLELIPVATELHQLITGYIFTQVDRFVEAQALGIVLFIGTACSHFGENNSRTRLGFHEQSQRVKAWRSSLAGR